MFSPKSNTYQNYRQAPENIPSKPPKKYIYFLLLGGLYSVFYILIYFLPTFMIKYSIMLLNGIAIFYLILLIFLKNPPKLLVKYYQTFPNKSHYLIFIGWINYAIEFLALIFLGIGYFLPNSPHTAYFQDKMFVWDVFLSCLFFIVLICSLILAFCVRLFKR